MNKYLPMKLERH